MYKCGICLEQYKMSHCNMCQIGVCDDCSFFGYHGSFQDNNLCKLCCPPVVVFRFMVYFRHCINCDTVFKRSYGRSSESDCPNCLLNPKNSRQLLPHYKAKPIIEIRYIPELAQIIFDYYYKPRRYYTAEI